MPNEIPPKAFAEYQALIEKVDSFQARVQERHPGQIECRAGCSECCRKIPRLILSPVEAFYLREQLRLLPSEEQARLGETSRTACLLARFSPMTPASCTPTGRCSAAPTAILR